MVNCSILITSNTTIAWKHFFITCVHLSILFQILPLNHQILAESKSLHDRRSRSTNEQQQSPLGGEITGLQFEFEPEILGGTDENITLRIFPVKQPLRNQVQSYYVIVEAFDESSSPSTFFSSMNMEKMNFSLKYHEAQEKGLPFYAAFKFQANELEEYIDVVIGDGSDKDNYYNPSLSKDQQYRFGLLAQLSNGTYLFIRSSRSIILISSDESNFAKTLIGVFAGLVVILIIIIAGLLYYLREASVQVRWQDVLMIWSKRHRSSLFKDRNLAKQREERARLTANQLENNRLSGSSAHRHLFSKPAMEVKHRVLEVSKLSEFLESPENLARLASEFTEVPTDQLMSWLSAKTETNKDKDRYTSLPAYDHNRVILEPERRDNSQTNNGRLSVNSGHSDYINASYIDGYDEPCRYIATQGPLQSTIIDFWKMIWQKDCRQIVMLTGLEEAGKVKCDQYWPEREEEVTYGDFKVKLISRTEYTDYIVRQFSVQKGDLVRVVTQYHYTSWPDHDVPRDPGALLTLMETVESEAKQLDVKSPLVVHCSAGVGRTGTYIMIDYMISMARKEGKIDILGQLYSLRKQRVHMIETVSQYLLVHKALAQYFAGSADTRKLEELKSLEDAAYQGIIVDRVNSKKLFHFDG